MVTMSAVWDRTSAFLGDHVAALAAIAAPTLYLSEVVQDVVQPLAAAAAPGPRLALGFAGLGLSLIGFFGSTAVIALALDPAGGARGAFARGAARFPAMVGIWVLLLLVVAALCLPAVIIAAAGGVDFSALSTGVVPNLSPLGGLLIVLYALIVLPVIAWLLARLAVLRAMVVAERRGVGAIRHAFALTRGLAGRIVGAAILFLVVALVAQLAARTVFGSLFRLAFGGRGPVDTAAVLTALVVALVSTAATVILWVFSVQLYVAVRDRTDLAPAAA